MIKSIGPSVPLFWIWILAVQPQGQVIRAELTDLPGVQNGNDKSVSGPLGELNEIMRAPCKNVIARISAVVVIIWTCLLEDLGKLTSEQYPLLVQLVRGRQSSRENL